MHILFQSHFLALTQTQQTQPTNHDHNHNPIPNLNTTHDLLKHFRRAFFVGGRHGDDVYLDERLVKAKTMRRHDQRTSQSKDSATTGPNAESTKATTMTRSFQLYFGPIQVYLLFLFLPMKCFKCLLANEFIRF